MEDRKTRLTDVRCLLNISAFEPDLAIHTEKRIVVVVRCQLLATSALAGNRSIPRQLRDHGVLDVQDVIKKFNVRTACVAERQELEALQWRASLANKGDREVLLANPDAIVVEEDQIAQGCVFVARDENVAKTVGFAAIISRGDGDFELDALFLEPDAWGQGIGRVLVDHCSLLAKSNHAAALHVICNSHAQGFYQACGFQLAGTEQTRFGPALRMVKPLVNGI